MWIRSYLGRAFLSLALSLCYGQSLVSQAAAARDPGEAFYRGKTVQIVVGFGAGGGYDLSARAVARYMGRYLPENPTVIVQNMPGAGSLVAANHLYKVAPKDGTVFGIFIASLVLEQLMGTAGLEFDAGSFNWIGSLMEDHYICVARKASPVKSLEDAMNIPIKLAASGSGTGAFIYPNLMNNLLGTKFNIILGYSGSSEMALAIERGEVDGVCESLSGMRTRHPEWLEPDNPFVNRLVLIGLSKRSDMPDVPLVAEFARDQATRGVFEVVTSTLAMGRPFAAPPGLPGERVATLRRAFVRVLEDPGFRSELQASGLEVYRPRDGEGLQQLVQQLLRAPKEQVELLRQYWHR